MSEPTPELEAAARALTLRWALDDIDRRETVETYTDQNWQGFVPYARAALAAVLTEPRDALARGTSEGSAGLPIFVVKDILRAAGRHILGEAS